MKLAVEAVVVFKHEGNMLPTMNEIDVGTSVYAPTVEVVMPLASSGKFVINITLGGPKP